MTFRDISVECDGKDCTSQVKWEAKVKDPNCNMAAHVDTPGEISITWDTTMASAFDNLTLDELTALNSRSGWGDALRRVPAIGA